MVTNLSRYKSDISDLIALGHSMVSDLEFRHLANTRKLNDGEKAEAAKLVGSFDREYQKWYTEAHALTKQLMPDRLTEFEYLYKGDGKRREISAINYSIQDWLNGMRAPNDFHGKKQYDDFGIIVMRFQTQLGILRAVTQRFESTLFDIRQLVQADLFDSELDAARELVERGFVRGAGAIAGVVLEKHLGQVTANHGIALRKQHPTISDLNDVLKNENVIEIPAWRLIQRLGDLRNLADHNKHREPTSEEIIELIEGVDKIAKTLF
jgi:hypothetical protein